MRDKDEESILEKVAATLATLQTMREILKDEYLENDRKLLCDVWCGTVAFSITKGCDEDTARFLMDLGHGPLRSPFYNTEGLLESLETCIKRIEDIPKNVARAELIRSMATGEPLFTIDLTHNT